MAKYVCDVEQVISAGEKMVSAGENLENSSNTYSSNIQSDISGWDGQAKTSFNSEYLSQMDSVSKKAKTMIEFGEFIKTSAKAIQELDDKLAEYDI